MAKEPEKQTRESHRIEKKHAPDRKITNDEKPRDKADTSRPKREE